jgi:hypothetical protein
VNYHNSELLAAAMRQKGILCAYLLFSTGGHAFGINPRKAGTEAIAWKTYFLEWLAGLYPKQEE